MRKRGPLRKDASEEGRKSRHRRGVFGRSWLHDPRPSCVISIPRSPESRCKRPSRRGPRSHQKSRSAAHIPCSVLLLQKPRNTDPEPPMLQRERPNPSSPHPPPLLPLRARPTTLGTARVGKRTSREPHHRLHPEPVLPRRHDEQRLSTLGADPRHPTRRDTPWNGEDPGGILEGDPDGRGAGILTQRARQMQRRDRTRKRINGVRKTEQIRQFLLSLPPVASLRKPQRRYYLTRVDPLAD